MLDMVVSFCRFVQMQGGEFAVPRLGADMPLVLKASRHPLLERLGDTSVVVRCGRSRSERSDAAACPNQPWQRECDRDVFVVPAGKTTAPCRDTPAAGRSQPNNVAMTPTSSFQLITGPNMSGKSTYLRQTALICLMAHVGCHVPAEYASMPLLSRIFTRIGASDSLETNGCEPTVRKPSAQAHMAKCIPPSLPSSLPPSLPASLSVEPSLATATFACEMREVNYILRNLGQPALVLVDELGRGTSNRDGGSLAHAVSEVLLRAPDTYTLFATHYLHLSMLKVAAASGALVRCGPVLVGGFGRASCRPRHALSRHDCQPSSRRGRKRADYLPHQREALAAQGRARATPPRLQVHGRGRGLPAPRVHDRLPREHRRPARVRRRVRTPAL